MADALTLQLGPYVDFMREHGVRSLRHGEVEIVLFERPQAVPQAPAESTPDTKACHCPHDDLSHTPDGFCMEGCEPAVCRGTKEQ